MPHETLGLCIGCGSTRAKWPIETREYVQLSTDQFTYTVTAVSCPKCNRDLSLYWFPHEFISYRSAWEDDITADITYLDNVQINDRQAVFTESHNLCCDGLEKNCSCSWRITWEDGVKTADELYDSAHDLYEYSENNSSAAQLRPSCFNCERYLTPSCVPLRFALYEIAHTAKPIVQPLRKCPLYEEDRVALTAWSQ